MIVTVKDNGVPSLSSTADIYVNVTDLNDHPPVFIPESYSVTIDEDVSYTECVIVYVSLLKSSIHIPQLMWLMYET